ncbi:LysR family transcriptional regulator [Haloferula sp. BvORR071]|uniref:LysR family transcriptional regulator n=1 Tax=Haloferula sp. BvORR071 TaxID=1396141 RepID=UPI0005562792|nr:LysR family transcriptional regulator [Haloferula sp. BvORR071]
MNEKPAIDLQELHLVRQVAAHRGITAAAKAAGLSQSALTRQLQGIEGRLGLRLFERTTRKLSLTPAGAVLLRETEVLPGLLDGALRRLREDFLSEQREIAIGISRSVSLAHLPGLFHGHLRHHPEVRVSVSHLTGSALVEAVAACKLDLAVLCPPPKLPGSVAITHRIEDVFVLIVPADMVVPAIEDEEPLRAWAAAQSWIMPPAGTRSRACIDQWWQKAKPAPPVAMELDSFDMTVQLVALGMGVAFVPRRTLSSFPRKRQIRRIKLARPLKRELAIIAPQRGTTPEHVREFIAGILFR